MASAIFFQAAPRSYNICKSGLPASGFTSRRGLAERRHALQTCSSRKLNFQQGSLGARALVSHCFVAIERIGPTRRHTRPFCSPVEDHSRARGPLIEEWRRGLLESTCLCTATRTESRFRSDGGERGGGAGLGR